MIRLSLAVALVALIAWAIGAEVRRDRKAKRWNRLLSESIALHDREVEKAFRFGEHRFHWFHADGSECRCNPTDEAGA